jgi:hypothetical protein
VAASVKFLNAVREIKDLLHMRIRVNSILLYNFQTKSLHPY